MAKLPTFMVIGAARSGTTALYRALRQHPDIFMSAVKEPNYFAFEGAPIDFRGPGAEFVNNSVASFDAYEALFEKAPEGAAIGEASPLYLHSAQAAPRIAARLPDVKLVAILRNPVEQAFSHYLYARAQMIEPLESFDAALDAEPERRAAHWQPLFQYSSFPRYGAQIERYLRAFPRDRIKIFRYEDLERAPDRLLAELQAFIGVDARFRPEMSRANPGGVPRNALLQRVVMRPNVLSRVAGGLIPESVRRTVRDRISQGNVARAEMSDAARLRLFGALHDDIVRLQDLVDLDFSAWLRAPSAASGAAAP